MAKNAKLGDKRGRKGREKRERQEKAAECMYVCIGWMAAEVGGDGNEFGAKRFQEGNPVQGTTQFAGHGRGERGTGVKVPVFAVSVVGTLCLHVLGLPLPFFSAAFSHFSKCRLENSEHRGRKAKNYFAPAAAAAVGQALAIANDDRDGCRD